MLDAVRGPLLVTESREGVLVPAVVEKVQLALAFVGSKLAARDYVKMWSLVEV